MKSEMKTAVIIQARMGSERFPGKVLQSLSGRPLLWHIVERVKRALTVSEIVVATTDNPCDDIVVNECMKMNIAVVRGSENDVLSRYYFASKVVKADKICRVTGDNPLVEPSFIDMAVARMSYSEEDYLCIDGCPLGTGIEVFDRKILNDAAKNAAQSYQREHVTPYMREKIDVFKIGQIKVPFDFYYPELRLTVDTRDDFYLIEMIYHRLYHEWSVISLREVIDLLLEEPELCKLNAHVQQKAVI